MTDDRARRLREMRNRAAGGARETAESEETEETAVTEKTEETGETGKTGATEETEETTAQGEADETAAEAPSADDDSADSGTESAGERDGPATSGDGTAADSDDGHVDSQQTVDAPSEAEQESDTADSETGAVETVEPAAADASAETDDGDVSLSFNEGDSVSDAGPNANAGGPLAALGGAVASQSTVAELTGTGAEPTVDGSATMADAEGYGDATAARKDAMFEQGNTLIHSTHDGESTIQMLEFYLNENRYAIEIDRISAIVEMKDITRFPRGPTAIDGVTDLRGEITGVLDPTTMLDVEHNELSDDQYIVVLERGDDKQKLGVRVTDVSQAVTYHDSQIDETGSVMDAAGDHQHECVRGIIKKQDDDDRTTLVAWLDIDELIANID
ncbi:chemotaxis protein CheW [Natrialba sp. SSL1]|uniref:chemotaxis protein CheW n=1 Tax=Natrialba sp. SSL1 TaxID=1869245 RepID=UPI0008F876B3|nr:chemotaxis protein CheW [Natrialba sp. SSL1]OIB57632.1 chemotaxis protein CheW [Natrialba sp. SSL1]